MFNTNRVVNKDILKKIVGLLQLLSLSTSGLFLNELSGRIAREEGAHRLFETLIPFKSGILLSKKL